MVVKILLSAADWAKEVLEKSGDMLSAFLGLTKGEYGAKKGFGGNTDINKPGRILRGR